MKKNARLFACLASISLMIPSYAETFDSSASTFSKAEKYFTGDGVEKNHQQAFQLFSKAARDGHAKAQNRLGECYQYGLGTIKNVEQAAIWYKKAADQGLPEAMFNYGQYCIFSNPALPDYRNGIAWIEKAANLGHAGSQSFLGTCFISGKGVAQNSRVAFAWFRKAAEQGNAQAQFYVGSCYYLGQGTTSDYATAIQWFRKAADMGVPEAYHALGECYEKGNGVEKNIETALFWYRKGAQGGLRASASSVAFIETQQSWKRAQPTIDKGRKIIDGILQVNADRNAAALSPIWPKKGQWKTSTEYLRWLVRQGFLTNVTEQEIEGWYCLVGAEKESQAMPFLWSSNLQLSASDLTAPANYSRPISWRSKCTDGNPVVVIRINGGSDRITPERLSDATFFLGRKPGWPNQLEILPPLANALRHSVPTVVEGSSTETSGSLAFEKSVDPVAKPTEQEPSWKRWLRDTGSGVKVDKEETRRRQQQHTILNHGSNGHDVPNSATTKNDDQKSEEFDIDELNRKRRASRIKRGQEALEKGRNALKTNNWTEAIDSFENALTFLPDEVEFQRKRREAAEGIAKGYYNVALEQEKAGNYVEAEKSLRGAWFKTDKTSPLFRDLQKTLVRIRSAQKAAETAARSSF